MKITREQFEELEVTREQGYGEFHELLEDYTGIVAHPYTAFDYYDSCGNYVGNSLDYTTRDLLDSAYIKIEGD